MKKIKIGIISPSEIAFRRFMPAIMKNDKFEYIGVAIASEKEWLKNTLTNFNDIKKIELEKANKFRNEYGGVIFNSYYELLNSDVDAIYIPLPPALHYYWGKKALLANKNVFMEKPFTIKYQDTDELVKIAIMSNLVVHENYMFQYHNQTDRLKEVMKNKEIDNIRIIRIDFGFPFRGTSDFRYNKELGGGAVFDCGGYVSKLATILLGKDIKVKTARLGYRNDLEVDLYGSVTFENEQGIVCQTSFGMDNQYRCNIDIWGDNKSLFSNRILTAPNDYEPVFEWTTNGKVTLENIGLDDSFYNSLNHFYECMIDNHINQENNEFLMIQSRLLNEIIEIGDKK